MDLSERESERDLSERGLEAAEEGETDGNIILEKRIK